MALDKNYLPPSSMTVSNNSNEFIGTSIRLCANTESIRKVLHARSAAEHDKYKEQHTNREAKGATASSFRGELKVLTKGAHNNNKVKRQKTKQ